VASRGGDGGSVSAERYYQLGEISGVVTSSIGVVREDSAIWW